MRICRVSNPSDCGTVARGGHIDFGRLENGGIQVPVPADNIPFPLPNCGSTNRRGHNTVNQFSAWYGFFYGNPACIPPAFQAGGAPLGNLQVGSLVNETWAKLNLADPLNPVIICPEGSCTNNESLREQAHLVAGDFNPALAVNGRINRSGFTNLYGFIDSSCTAANLTCAPFSLVNVPTGGFQYRDDAFGIGKKQYDVLFNGQPSGWIKFPGLAQNPVPTNTPTSSGPFVSTEVNPTSLNIGGTALVSVKLNNVPAEGFKSAEFTCNYNASLVEKSNIVATNLFGADAVVAINEHHAGTFIVAIAGTNGNKATTNGPAFTFSVKGLQVGQSVIQCTARASKGDNLPIDLSSTGASLTILGVEPSPTPFSSPTLIPNGSPQPTTTNTPLESPTPTSTFTPLPSPTATPSPNGSLNGQVIAGKPVTISMFDANNVVIASVVANPDGTFSLTALAGNYTVVAMSSGFLSHQGPAIITAGNTTGKPTISLLAGDIDGNNIIDQFDALTIGMSYNTVTPSAADLNNDGTINFLDLELLAENYRKTGPSAW